MPIRIFMDFLKFYLSDLELNEVGALLEAN